MLNHFETDLEIFRESAAPRVGKSAKQAVTPVPALQTVSLPAKRHANAGELEVGRRLVLEDPVGVGPVASRRLADDDAHLQLEIDG